MITPNSLSSAYPLGISGDAGGSGSSRGIPKSLVTGRAKDRSVELSWRWGGSNEGSIMAKYFGFFESGTKLFRKYNFDPPEVRVRTGERFIVSRGDVFFRRYSEKLSLRE